MLRAKAKAVKDAADARRRAMEEKKWAREQDRLNKLGKKHTLLQPIDQATKTLRNGIEVQMWYYPDDQERDEHADKDRVIRRKFNENLKNMK